MTHKLTRAQLDALALLHSEVGLWGQGHGIGLSGPRQGTLNALVNAGVARRDPEDGRHILPAVKTWADASGTWHAAIPVTVENRRAAAVAVIAGEVWQRERQAYIDHWRPRVHLDALESSTPSTIAYREV